MKIWIVKVRPVGKLYVSGETVLEVFEKAIKYVNEKLNVKPDSELRIREKDVENIQYLYEVI